MNLIIVSWNIQGQFSLAQLIDRMIENGWDLLIVLEPQRAARVEVSHPGIAIARVHVGDQYIYVLAATTISDCLGRPGPLRRSASAPGGFRTRQLGTRALSAAPS